MTKEEFTKRVRNENYDFSETNYIDLVTPIEVLCLIHGKFSIIPRNMLYKDEGCKLCGINKMKKTKSLTKQEFVKRAKKIHKDEYDYSLVDYVNNKIKVAIICKKCGETFFQTPNNHLKGCGCPNCN